VPLVDLDSRYICEILGTEQVTLEERFFECFQGPLEVGIDLETQRYPLLGGAILAFIIAVIDPHIDELTFPILG
jgi:hypothetical protein